MAKLTAAFRCVRAGEIYPEEIAAGEECPPEHEESARAQGCLAPAEPAKAQAKKK
jgi:hypothetical protein